jgi:hypothetical protein
MKIFTHACFFSLSLFLNEVNIREKRKKNLQTQRKTNPKGTETKNNLQMRKTLTTDICII